MFEMPHARKHHRDVMFIGGRDYFLVTDRNRRVESRDDALLRSFVEDHRETERKRQRP
jgi:hypothetical protein